MPSQGILSANLPKTGRLVVYCGEENCPLSERAAEKLISYGYKNVWLLDGGFGAWLAKGYPSETGAMAARRHGRHTPRMRAREARREMDAGRTFVLDVRPAIEFSAGHIHGARNVPLEEIDPALAWLGKDKDILVCDRSSARSRQAVKKLQDAGFNASELSGGIAGWIKKKEPLEVQ